jgi:hypothetical protein
MKKWLACRYFYFEKTWMYSAIVFRRNGNQRERSLKELEFADAFGTSHANALVQRCSSQLMDTKYRF